MHENNLNKRNKIGNPLVATRVDLDKIHLDNNYLHQKPRGRKLVVVQDVNTTYIQLICMMTITCDDSLHSDKLSQRGNAWCRDRCCPSPIC